MMKRSQNSKIFGINTVKSDSGMCFTDIKK